MKITKDGRYLFTAEEDGWLEAWCPEKLSHISKVQLPVKVENVFFFRNNFVVVIII